MTLFKQRIIKKQFKKSKPNQSQFHVNLNIGQSLDARVLQNHNRACTKFICSCVICCPIPNETQAKGFNFLRLKRAKSIDINKSVYFNNLLDYLLPKSKKKGLKILIPEICFFKNGSPKSLYMNSRDQIKVIKSDKLDLKKVFDIFTQQKGIYMNALAKNFQSDILKEIDFEDEMHEKYTETLYPSFKVGGTSIHKGFKNFRIHKNDKLLLNPLESHRIKNTDEICLIYYSDQHCKLMNDQQFKQYMTTSKIISRKVQMMQSFIKQKNQTDQFYYTSYKCYNDLQNKELFQKAQLQVDILLQIISKVNQQYITNQGLIQFNNSLKINPQEYVLYQTYKIVHYMKKCHDIKIQVLKLGWTINQIDLFYLSDVIQFQYDKIICWNQKKFTKKQLSAAKNIKPYPQVQEILLKKWSQYKKQTQKSVMLPKKNLKQTDFMKLVVTSDFQPVQQQPQKYKFELTTQVSKSGSYRNSLRTKQSRKFSLSFMND